MRFVRLSTILQILNSQLVHRNALGASLSPYSTTAAAATGTDRDVMRRKWSGSMNRLYRMISPIRDPSVSIDPLLDQWIQEGGAVDKEHLQVTIKQLYSKKRFTHALQMSMWMSDRRYFVLEAIDVAIRLDLICKVQGIEQAEDYFNNIPKKLRIHFTYRAHLNCYVYVRNVEKAEATMDKIREMGLAKGQLVYNSLLSLYHVTGNYEKLESLMHEMEEKGIGWDIFTYCIRLTAYAAISDTEGIDKTVSRMESDADVVFDWTTYSTVASAYEKVGMLDKALTMIKKSEGLISGGISSTAYEFLITQYAKCGKKDDVLRLWQAYKEVIPKVFSKGYISVITSVLRFDALECAERIFEEWESEASHFDIRIPNFLIGAYSRKGLLEKAETLVDKIILKGEKPDERTWYYLATGYFQVNQPQKAVEKMKEAVVVCDERWKPDKTVLAACLDYFKHQGDNKGAGNFINLLADKNVISVDVQDRLLDNFFRQEPNLDALSELNADTFRGGHDSVRFGFERNRVEPKFFRFWKC